MYRVSWKSSTSEDAKLPMKKKKIHIKLFLEKIYLVFSFKSLNEGTLFKNKTTTPLYDCFMKDQVFA